jgi:predicted nucleotidyltransferase
MHDKSKRQCPMKNLISTDFNNADLLQRLTDGGVSFLLVGGAAVAFYGCRADRYLPELDILIDPAIENAERVMAVLSAMGVQLWINAKDLAGPKKQLPVKQLLFDMDILTPAADENFSAILAQSVEGMVNGNAVRVIGREDLIAMKRVAARTVDTGAEKHQVDLDCLVRQDCLP